jgi:hypothetical protein
VDPSIQPDLPAHNPNARAQGSPKRQRKATRASVRLWLTEAGITKPTTRAALLDDEWVTPQHIEAWIGYVRTQSSITEMGGFIASKLKHHIEAPEYPYNSAVYQQLLTLSNQNYGLAQRLAADAWITIERIDAWARYVKSQPWILTPGYTLRKLIDHVEAPQPAEVSEKECLSRVAECLKRHQVSAWKELASDTWMTVERVEAWFLEAVARAHLLRSVQADVVLKLRAHQEPPAIHLKAASRNIQRQAVEESIELIDTCLTQEQRVVVDQLMHAGVIAPLACELARDTWVTWQRVCGWVFEIGFNDVTEEYPEGRLVRFLRLHQESIVEC